MEVNSSMVDSLMCSRRNVTLRLDDSTDIEKLVILIMEGVMIPATVFLIYCIKKYCKKG